jgi:hypothetical protein
MNADATADETIPGLTRENRWAAGIGSFLTALLINGFIVGLLLFIIVGEPRLTPPGILVTSIPEPEKPFVEPPKIQRTSPSIQAGGAPLAPALTITASATSAISMTIPDLPSTDDGVSALAGIGNGFGSGMGSGFGDGEAEGATSMKVGGMKVQAKVLGVILDVSGSMKEKLPEVKREIRRAFRQAKTVDVEGCRLDWNAPDESEDRKVRLKGSADSVIEAVEMLVIDGRIDALYWFSDLQDGESEAGLARLRELLRVGHGKRRRCAFTFAPWNENPPANLLQSSARPAGRFRRGKRRTRLKNKSADLTSPPALTYAPHPRRGGNRPLAVREGNW